MASILIHIGLVSAAVHVGLPVTELPADVIAAELTAPEPMAPAPPPRKVAPPAPRVAPPKPEPPRVDTLPKLLEAPPPKVEEPPRIADTPPPPPPPPVVASGAESAPGAPAAAPTVSLPQASAPMGQQRSQTSGVSIVTEPRQTPAPASSPPTPGPTASIDASAITRNPTPRGGQVRPSYPPRARSRGVEGTTMLKVHVHSDGRVGDVDVAESSGHDELDEAAKAAVRRWRFEPARRGTEPIAMTVEVPVEFRLKERGSR